MKITAHLIAIVAVFLAPWEAIHAQCPGAMPTEPSNLRDLQTVVPTTGKFQGWSWTGGSTRGEVVLVEGLPTITNVCEIQYINNGSHVRFDGQTFRVVKRLPEAISTEISYSNLDTCSPHALLLRNITADPNDIPPFRIVRFRTGGCDGNGLPAINPIGPVPTIREGDVLNIDLSASDRDVPFQTLTYSIDNPLPGMSITPTGGDGDRRSARFTWATGEDHGPGVHSVTVRVSDSYSSPASATTTFAVTIQEANQAPEIHPIAPPVTVTREEQTMQRIISAWDRDVPSNPLTYSLDKAPSGMTIDPTSGMITWTPTELQGPKDTEEVVVRVSDQSADPTAPSRSATTTFWVSVQEANRAPYFPNPINQPVVIREEQTMSLRVPARDDDMPPNPLTYSLDKAPSGMIIDPTSGMITWTPTELQGPKDTEEVVVRVSDQSADPTAPSLPATVGFVVSVQEVNSPPTLDTVPIQRLRELEPWTYRLSATDTDIPPNPLRYEAISWVKRYWDPEAGMIRDISGNGLPKGMLLDVGNGVLSWTPSAGQGAAEYSLTVRVEDASTDPLSSSLLDEMSLNLAVKAVSLGPLRIVDLGPGTGRVELRFEALPGQTYRLEVANDMEGPWALLKELAAGPVGEVVAVEQAAAGTARFFRVVEP